MASVFSTLYWKYVIRIPWVASIAKCNLLASHEKCSSYKHIILTLQSFKPSPPANTRDRNHKTAKVPVTCQQPEWAMNTQISQILWILMLLFGKFVQWWLRSALHCGCFGDMWAELCMSLWCGSLWRYGIWVPCQLSQPQYPMVNFKGGKVDVKHK